MVPLVLVVVWLNRWLSFGCQLFVAELELLVAVLVDSVGVIGAGLLLKAEIGVLSEPGIVLLVSAEIAVLVSALGPVLTELVRLAEQVSEKAHLAVLVVQHSVFRLWSQVEFERLLFRALDCESQTRNRLF